MCKLSVIIPVHNTETALSRCVESVLGQDFSDFELLLIDDGSIDGSGALCDWYAEKDSRVHVFHKAYGGASSARNEGLNHASGEWVAFIDSDDYVDKGYFTMPYSDEIDLYVRNLSYPNGENGTCFLSQTVIGKQYWDFLRHSMHQFSFRSACCLVAKRAIVEAHGVRFDERFRLGEDTLFVMDCYPLCQSLQVVEGPCYRYDRSEHWAEKYNLSWKEAEQCLSVFMDKYEKLPVKAPELPALMFGLYRIMIDKHERQMHWKWLRSAPVKRYIETQIPEKGWLFGLKYWIKEMCRK